MRHFKPNLCYTVRGEVTEIMDKLEPRHGHPEPVESSETHKHCPRLVASVGAGQLSPKNVWQRWPLTVTVSLYLYTCITLYHQVLQIPLTVLLFP